jgi:hypothetical protein
MHDHHAHDHHHDHHQPARQGLPASLRLGSPILAMSAARRLGYAAIACFAVWAAGAWALLAGTGAS